MTDPIPVRVTRYRCPHCARSHSSRGRAVQHMGRCWRNPEARGCKTCRHFDNTYEDYGEGCNAGVDLTGREACQTCVGEGFIYTVDYVRAQCPDCKGDGSEIKPGPIVHCEKWEARP